jgi:hypothetical protein
VVKRNNSYTLVWDSWESALRLKIGQDAGVIKQAYTVEAVKQDAKLKGYRVTEKKTDKAIRLVLSR